MTVAVGNVALNADETLLGFVSRLAAANALSLSAFLSVKGTTLRDVAFAQVDAVEKIAKQWNLDRERLAARGMQSEDGWTWIGDRRNSYRSLSWRRTRYCPRCVGRDFETGVGVMAARAYQRASWLSPFVDVCVEHRICLVSAPDALDEENPGDFAGVVARHRKAIATEAESAFVRDVHPSQAYFRRRMDEPVREGAFLDQMTTHAAATACNAFGRLLEAASHDDASLMVAVGYDAISRGPKAMRSAISKRLAAVSLRTTSTRLAVYGPVFVLLRDDEQGLFGPVRDAIREDGLSRLPLGVGEDFLGPVEERRLHSIRTASEQHGINARHVRYVFRTRGLITAKDDKKRDHDVIVPAAAADALLAKFDMGEVVTQRKAAEVLEASSDVLSMLVAKGYFTHHGRSRRGEFPARQLEQFQDLLGRKLRPAERGENLVPIREASRRSGLLIKQILILILEERIEAFRDPASAPTVASALIPGRVVMKTLAKERRAATDPNFLSARAAAKQLAVSDQTLKLLLSSGRLSHHHIGDWKTAAIAIPKDALDDFAQRHISTWQVHKATGMAMGKISEYLRTNGVLPVISSNGRSQATFFLRDEVQSCRFP